MNKDIAFALFFCVMIVSVAILQIEIKSIDEKNKIQTESLLLQNEINDISLSIINKQKIINKDINNRLLKVEEEKNYQNKIISWLVSLHEKEYKEQTGVGLNER